MYTLKIGRRLTASVATLEEAQRIYSATRDDSGEGVRTFPNGSITGDGKKYRISYNGRVWLGDKPIC